MTALADKIKFRGFSRNIFKAICKGAPMGRLPTSDEEALSILSHVLNDRFNSPIDIFIEKMSQMGWTEALERLSPKNGVLRFWKPLIKKGLKSEIDAFSNAGLSLYPKDRDFNALILFAEARRFDLFTSFVTSDPSLLSESIDNTSLCNKIVWESRSLKKLISEGFWHPSETEIKDFVLNSDFTTILILHEAEVDFDIVFDKGNSVLHFLACEIRDGCFPHIFASCSSPIHTFRFLIHSVGLDPFLPNDEGQTPIDLLGSTFPVFSEKELSNLYALRAKKEASALLLETSNRSDELKQRKRI